jgi:hypothetical protein
VLAAAWRAGAGAARADGGGKGGQEG